MATENKFIKRDIDTGTFHGMMDKGFGIVTVMNARVYDPIEFSHTDLKTPKEIIDSYKDKQFLCELKTLKVANVTQEGPNKTVTGGQYSNPLIKFGKSARLEMQDALGNARAIEALGGATVGYTDSNKTVISALHFSEEFAGPKTIIGESFFIDQKSGKQVPVEIIFYQFLPDSIFNLTQDAEGDATVFDMNGDLLTTDVKLYTDADNYVKLGLFYSIVEPEGTSSSTITIDDKNLVVTGNPKNSTVYYSSDAGNTWSNDKPTPTVGNRYYVKVVDNKGNEIFITSVVAAKTN